MVARTTPREPSIFSAASPALRAAIERSAAAMSLAPGITLFSQGDAADTFYILDSGEIEISVVSPGGRKLTIERMTPGEVFGEIGLFAGKRTATAAAVGAVRLRRVRRADLMAAIRADPELAIEFIEMLCDRLRTNVEMLEERSFQPLPTRLARRLLAPRRQARPGGRRDPGQPGRSRRLRGGDPRGGGQDPGAMARAGLGRAHPRRRAHRRPRCARRSRRRGRRVSGGSRAGAPVPRPAP